MLFNDNTVGFDVAGGTRSSIEANVHCLMLLEEHVQVLKLMYTVCRLHVSSMLFNDNTMCFDVAGGTRLFNVAVERHTSMQHLSSMLSGETYLMERTHWKYVSSGGEVLN
jgi:hypothetical protein